MQTSETAQPKIASCKINIEPPSGPFASYSNANIVTHVFQWQEDNEQVLISMFPGKYAVLPEDFTGSKRSALTVLAGSLTLFVDGQEKVIRPGESADLALPPLLHFKTDVFTQAMLVNSPKGIADSKVPATPATVLIPSSPADCEPCPDPKKVFWLGAKPKGTRF